MNTVFQGIFDSSLTDTIAITDFLLCVAVSLVVGLILSVCYMYRTRYTKSFVATVALLPAVVCVVIMMVNGNVGTGVAVAGAFGLVRFRSAAGTAKQINVLFLAMATGLMSGMGYLGYAMISALLFGIIMMVYNTLDFGSKKNSAKYQTLHITIPEDLDYVDVFEPILEQYTDEYDLTMVKTTNMGSLFRLTYDITLKDPKDVKHMIDALRCRNGNLEISISRQEIMQGEL